MTAEYNEWAEHTVSELWDELFNAEERLEKLEAEPVNYYSAGYSDTYLAAMSQVWGIQSCRDKIKNIRAEIDRRKHAVVEESTGDQDTGREVATAIKDTGAEGV